MIQNSPSIHFKLEDQQGNEQLTDNVSYNLSNTHIQSTHFKQIKNIEQDSNFKCKKLTNFNSAVKPHIREPSQNQKLKTQEFFQQFDKHFKIQFKSPPKIVQTSINKPLIEIFQQQQQLIQSNVFNDLNYYKKSQSCRLDDDLLMTRTIRFKRYNKLDKITTIKRKMMKQSQQKDQILTPPLVTFNRKLMFQKILNSKMGNQSPLPQVLSLNRKNRTLVSMDYTKKKQLESNNIFKMPLKDLPGFNNLKMGEKQNKNMIDLNNLEKDKLDRKFRLQKYRTNNSVSLKKSGQVKNL